MEYELNLISAEEMMKWAGGLAKEAEMGDIFLLKGELGAGKTTFTRGFLRGLGGKAVVKSPTYTIMREYDTEKGKVLHLDLYRLSGWNDLRQLGWPDIIEDYFVVLVEWAERVGDNAPRDAWRLNFEALGNNKRIVTYEKPE